MMGHSSKVVVHDLSFLRGKTVLVTGATSGLGAACITHICALGPDKPRR